MVQTTLFSLTVDAIAAGTGLEASGFGTRLVVLDLSVGKYLVYYPLSS